MMWQGHCCKCHDGDVALGDRKGRTNVVVLDLDVVKNLQHLAEIVVVALDVTAHREQLQC